MIMKKIILLALTTLMMVRCGNIKNSDGTYRLSKSPNVYIIDSCEYVGYIGYGNKDIIAHKGTCRFCKERRQKDKKNAKVTDNTYYCDCPKGNVTSGMTIPLMLAWL